MHSPAGASTAASLPVPRLPATPLAETPLYTKRLGRPPVTPGDAHLHPSCCAVYCTSCTWLVRPSPHQHAQPARPKSSAKRGCPGLQEERLWTGSNGSLKEAEGLGARRRPTVVAPDVADTPMSVASALAEPYVPTPASTVRSTDKENDTSWANGRPNHWLSDHRNPMYGQVCMLLRSAV